MLLLPLFSSLLRQATRSKLKIFDALFATVTNIKIASRKATQKKRNTCKIARYPNAGNMSGIVSNKYSSVRAIVG